MVICSFITIFLCAQNSKHDLWLMFYVPTECSQMFFLPLFWHIGCRPRVMFWPQVWTSAKISLFTGEMLFSPVSYLSHYEDTEVKYTQIQTERQLFFFFLNRRYFQSTED